MKKFLAVSDLSTEEILHVLDRADALRERWHANDMPKSLAKERVALWFYGNGFRNRLAFEIGARAMGADVAFVPGELGVHEPLVDIGHYLGNWFSMLVVRAKRHADLLGVANRTDFPLINARTSYNHPCEIVGDLQYIRQKRGSLDGLNVAFVGEASNLCMSWLEAATRLPIAVTQIAPPGYAVDPAVLARMSRGARGTLSVSHDLHATIGSSTEVIYTDCWPKVEAANDVARTFLPYQIDASVLSRMSTSGFFLPCPPVTRGQEVSVDAMNSPLCQNYAAKACLLHAQNAIMEFVASGVGRGPRGE